MFEYKPVTLQVSYGDPRAVLAFRDGRLVAILSCLADAHGAQAGQWFVETMFDDRRSVIHDTFATLDEFEKRIEDFV